MARRYWLTLAVSVAVVGLDLATKAMIEARIPLHHAVPVVDGLFSLVHVRNTGAAFSLLAEAPAGVRIPLFTAIAVGAAVAVLALVRKLDDRQWLLTSALALVLGGAVGNLVDRLRYGAVVDFLLVYWRDWHWPAFNVADSAISVGVVVLLWTMTFGRDTAARA